MSNAPQRKVVSLTTLMGERERAKEAGRRVVLCHGVFDVLHIGHLRHLSAARLMADVLIVSVTDDAYVGKGPGRPVFSSALRAEALAALECVDWVVISPAGTAIPTIEALRPDTYAKGSEYRDTADPTGGITRETQAVRMHGGDIAFTEEVTFSSSALINRYFQTQSTTVEEWLDRLRVEHSVDEVLHYITSLSKLRVAVLGEAIVDAYTACEVLGKSSKSPTLCLSRGPTSRQSGGSLAIAAHCAGLGMSTTAIPLVGSDTQAKWLRSEAMARGIHWKPIVDTTRPTVTKERLTDARTGISVLEVYDMNGSPLGTPAEDDLTQLLQEFTNAFDILYVADYGHGMLTARAISALSDVQSFLALNVQANAGNRGLNSIDRYSSASFVSLNGAEAAAEARRHRMEVPDLVPQLASRLGASTVLVTQGSDGIDIYDSVGGWTAAPAFTSLVKDRVGAGDAVLAIGAGLAKVDTPPLIIGFICNLVGAWAVSFTGNEQYLNLGVLCRQTAALLK